MWAKPCILSSINRTQLFVNTRSGLRVERSSIGAVLKEDEGGGSIIHKKIATRKGMNMKKILIAGALIILLGILFSVNLLKKEKGKEVTAESTRYGSVQQKVTGSGQIQPALEVKVSAQVAGKIVRLNAKEGDKIKKGTLLAALDPEQYLASVDRAESSLLAAKANEKKAKSELTRAQGLSRQKLISNAELESAEAAYESAVSGRRQAEASLKEARDALRKTKLYASMDGVVTRLNKEAGEMAIGAQFQEDVIMVVSDLSVMEAVVEIDENDVINISAGDSALVELDAFADTTFKGVVREIANSAVTKGRGTQEQVTSFEVTIVLDHPDKRFRPGMSTTVDILTKRLNHVLKIPIQSVTVRDKKELEKKATKKKQALDSESEKEMVEVVFVIKDGHALAKSVKLGISDDTHYAVKSGLEEGDMVITGPFKLLNKNLKNGDLVSIKDQKKAN